MPIYEYECTKCGKVSEIWQQMSDKPLKKCPACSGKLQKLISRSTFHLKGSGWYTTDYAGKPASSDSGKASAGESPVKKQPKKENVSSKKQDSVGSKSE